MLHLHHRRQQQLHYRDHYRLTNTQCSFCCRNRILQTHTYTDTAIIDYWYSSYHIIYVMCWCMWLCMVDVDDTQTHSSRRLAWSEGGSRLVLFYIHQMNRVNTCNDLCHDDSTIKSIIFFTLGSKVYYYYYLYLYCYALYKVAFCQLLLNEYEWMNESSDAVTVSLYVCVQVCNWNIGN